MHVPSTAELLHVWELGQSQTLPQRALLLLIASCVDVESETLEGISVGQRDALLLNLREQLFGRNMACLVVCPACGNRLEMSMQVPEIQVNKDEIGTDLAKVQSMHVDDYDLEFRSPNNRDLIVIADAPEGEDLRRLLLERCFQKIARNQEILPIDELPKNIMDAVIEKMAQIDSQADVRLSLTCPSCQHQWFATFDIVSFLWNELNSWAIRLLNEVRILAKNYGWSEKDILNMSSFRRYLYLEMATK
jgi:hypothetical protein